MLKLRDETGKMLVIFFIGLGNYLVAQNANNLIDSNGLRQGEWIMSNEESYGVGLQNDSIFQVYFVNDTLHGRCREYVNEKLVYEVHYKMGIKHGVEKYYGPNMDIKQISFFSKGMIIYSAKYYGNQVLESETHFVEGKKHGEYREYYLNGKLRLTREYKKGLCDGQEKYFTKKGKVDLVITFKDDRIVATSKNK